MRDASQIRKVIFIGFLAFVVFLISVFLIWEILKFTFVFKILNYVVQNIVNVSGMSPWLAKGIVILVLIPFFLALGELFKIRFKFNIFRRKPVRSYRKLALVVVVVYVSLFFLSMYFFSRGTYFGHTTGEILKWYAETPEGIRFFDSPGYDPKYGIKLKPVTPEMIMKYQKRVMGLIPNRIKLDSVETYEFFDRITGEPKVWYYINKEGEYELFDCDGYHPITREKLKAITPEIVTILKRKEEEKRKYITLESFIAYKNKFVNLSVLNKKETREVAIVIIDEDSKERLDIAQSISYYLYGLGLNPLLSLFKNPFISEGLFDKIFSGDTNKIKELQIIKNADYVLLGRKLTLFRSNPELDNLISAEVNLELKIVSAETGLIVKSQGLSAIGAGFTNSNAEQNALELLKSKIDNFLKDVFKK